MRRSSKMPRTTRRTLLSGLAAMTCAGTLSPASAQAFPRAFSSFGVDVSGLKARGLGAFADLIGAAALDELQRSFADRIDRAGPRLVVSFRTLTMTAFPDGGVGRWARGGSGGGTDSLDGEALALGK